MTFTFNTERSPLLNAEQLKDYFKKYINESKKEIIVCSAYITTPGIQWFKENIEDKNVKCRIVTKWSPSDLLSGSSSLDIYSICKSNKWTLEIIEDLHVKFYLMDKKHLITGSLNLTGRGIGLVPISNKEFGVYLETTNDDLSNIDLLLEDTTIVDDHIYNLYEKWLLDNKDFVKQKIPELPIGLKNIKEKKLTKIWVTNFPWISPGEFLSNINTKMNKKIRQGLKFIDQIQNIRSKNNKNWMDLLRLSLELDFDKTSKIIKEICKDDKRISNLAQKIYKLKD